MEQRAGGPNGLIGKELRITAFVQDWFYNTTSSGFQSAVVYDEDIELKFLGGSVWTFKPDLPFKILVKKSSVRQFHCALSRGGSHNQPGFLTRLLL